MATVAELITTLEEHLDYSTTGSVASAKQVVVACEKLLLKRPSSASHGGSSMTYDMAQIRDILERARGFVSQNEAGGRVRFLGQSDGFKH